MDTLGTFASAQTVTRVIEGNADQGQYAKLRNMLRQRIFGPLIVNGQTTYTVPQALIDHILSEDNMRKYFTRAFRHRSYRGEQADYGMSYDSLETHGDTVVNSYISKIILVFYGDRITNDEQNKMLSYYKSNNVFSEFLLKAIPEIGDYILISPKLRPLQAKIYADVFEALIAAIQLSIEEIPGAKGLGTPCAENVLRLLTRNFQPDSAYGAGNPKSQIIEIFGKDSVREQPSKGEDFNGSLRVEVVWAEEQRILNLFPNLAANDPLRFQQLTASGNNFTDITIARNAVYTELVNKLVKASVPITTKTVTEADVQNIVNAQTNGLGPRIIAITKTLHIQLLFIKQDSDHEGMKVWDLVMESTAPDTKGMKRFVTSEQVSKNPRTWYVAKDRLLAEFVRMYDQSELF